MTPAHPCRDSDPSAPPRFLPGAANSPDVSASGDFPKLRVLDLFSGIGGFSLGLERTGGFETVAFCEIEPFPRRVLAKHWPEVPCYDDVRTLSGTSCGRVDVITAGFPCQDISLSGRGEGITGTRSGLWSEVARLVGELRPSFVVLENSPALLVRGFEVVLSDLAALGYDAQWHCIPAAYAGAAHLRDRIWVVAYPMQIGGVSPASGDMDWTLLYQAEWPEIADATGRHAAWAPEPGISRVANGLPNIVDRRSALGNAVVPQIPELIGHAILQAIRPHNAADAEPAAFRCPSGPTALVPDCGASSLAANGNASGTPFVDCLNGPGAIVPRAGATHQPEQLI